MSLRNQLRVSNPKQSILENALYQYPGRVIVETQPDIRYLQLLMTDEYHRQAIAFFNIDSWLLKMDSHLPGMPWQQVPLSYLASWLNTLQLSFLVEGTIWLVENVSLPEQSIPNPLLALEADPCALLCTDWPSGPRGEDEAEFSLSWLPLTLRYVLGSSQVPLSILAELVPGDLLPIRQQKWHLEIERHKLFIFSYQGNDEVIVKKTVIDNLQSERIEEEHLLDWANLPVDLEFVLDSHKMTLGDLNNINVGSVLPVSSGAEQRVKIYLNRKFFAIGELVALEDSSLAVEVKQISLHPEDKMSDADAE